MSHGRDNAPGIQRRIDRNICRTKKGRRRSGAPERHLHLTPMPFRHPRTMKLIEPRRRHSRKAFELFFAIMASLRFRSFYLMTL